ncbi:MAG: sugar phosphate nucleotidyltransferase [Fidelibacterota bacterium]
MKQAVILIAGGGTRLGSRNQSRPKCLLKVKDKSLLEWMLNYLIRARIEETILVVGYQADYIHQQIGSRWKNMTIKYVQNQEWEQTNNVVSLALATDLLHQDFILLEGDLIFQWEAFSKMLVPNRIALDRFQPHMDGTVVSINDNGNVEQFYLKSTPSRPLDLSSLYKTVNIYSFNYQDYMSAVVPRLRFLVDSGQNQLYYEQAIADAVADEELQLQIVLFSGSLWYEIDTEEDLLKAKALFQG